MVIDKIKKKIYKNEETTGIDTVCDQLSSHLLLLYPTVEQQRGDGKIAAARMTYQIAAIAPAVALSDK